MAIRLMGANPGLTLRSATGVTGYASAWRVDWSEQGKGTVLVVWHEDAVQVIGSDPQLGRWLATEFNQHFPEVDGLPWPDPSVTEAPVELHIDLDTGMTAKGGDVTIEITDAMREPKPSHVPDFDLGGVPHMLTNVYRPFRAGRLTIGDVAVEGKVTAFLADAEVWSTS